MTNNIRLSIFKLQTNKKDFFSALLVGVLPFAVMFLGTKLAVLSWDYSLWISLPISFLVITVNATRFRALNNMSHECLHRTYTQNLAANEFFGYFFAAAEFSSFKRIRREHSTHHAYLGDFSRDKDFENLTTFRFERNIDRSVLKEHFLRGLSFGFWKHYFFLILFDREDPFWASLLRFGYLTGILTLLVFYPLPMLSFFILPYVSVYQIHKYWIDFLDHGGILQSAKAIHQTRNFLISNSILHALFFPRNDGYHLIHHLFPALPIEEFPTAHQILLKDPEYQRQPHSAKEQILLWLKVQKGNPDVRIQL